MYELVTLYENRIVRVITALYRLKPAARFDELIYKFTRESNVPAQSRTVHTPCGNVR